MPLWSLIEIKYKNATGWNEFMQNVYKQIADNLIAWYPEHARDLPILALSTVDFKRHKDVMGYFNKEYVAKEIFPREIGRKLGTLQRVREKSDYDDFYIASREKAEEQFQTAELVIGEVKKYLDK